MTIIIDAVLQDVIRDVIQPMIDAPPTPLTGQEYEFQNGGDYEFQDGVDYQFN